MARLTQASSFRRSCWSCTSRVKPGLCSGQSFIWAPGKVGYQNKQKENRIFEYNYDSVESPFNESILLAEGSSYKTKNLEDSEFFQKAQVIESEILTNSLFNITKVSGWENSFVLAMNTVVKERYEEEIKQSSSPKVTAFLAQSYMINDDFITLQLRNYFMFQSIIKAMAENPNKRIIVTAGTCHFACEETIFDLLDSANVSYTTIEERASVKDALVTKKLKSSLSNLLFDGSYMNITEKNAMTIRSEMLTQVSKIAEKLMSTESAFDYLPLDARSFYESKDHIFNFFRKEAYLAPKF